MGLKKHLEERFELEWREEGCSLFPALDDPDRPVRRQEYNLKNVSVRRVIFLKIHFGCEYTRKCMFNAVC